MGRVGVVIVLLLASCGGGGEKTATTPEEAGPARGLEALPGPEARTSAMGSLRLTSVLGGRQWLHPGGWDLVFHPTRPLLLSRGRAPQRLWNLETGRIAGTLPESEERYACVAWSPDGSWIAVGTGREVRILDGETFEETDRVGGFREVKAWAGVNSLAIAPDGTTLVACGAYDEIRAWDTASWSMLYEKAAHSQGISAVQFAPDGSWFATCGGDYGVRAWDTRTGAPLWFAEHESFVEDLAIAPNGKAVASASMDETVVVWSASDGSELARFECGHNVNGVTWSPDGRWLVAVEDWGRVRCWDARTMKEAWVQIAHAKGDVRCVRFSPDGKTLASLSEDGAIRLWDVKTGEILNRWERHDGCVHCLALTPDGRRLISGSEDGTARIWDADSGRLLRTLRDHEDAVRAIAVAPGGAWMLTGAETSDTTRNLLKWRLDREAPPEPAAEHEILVYALAITPDGERFVSTGGRWLRTWESDGTHRRTLKGHGSFTTALAMDPQGAWVASGNHDGTARIWDLESGEARHVLKPDMGRVKVLAVTKDGRRLAGGGHGRVHVWNPETGEHVRAWTTHGDQTTGIAFTDDDRLLLVIVDDELEVLDLETGKALDRVGVPGDPHVVIQRGGRVWVGCEDGTIAVYRLTR